jgi:hypothetical protein
VKQKTYFSNVAILIATREQETHSVSTLARDKMSTIKELTTFTASKLKAFLRERRIPVNGTKSELLQLSRLYFNRPVLRVDHEGEDQQAKGGGPFGRVDLQWSVITNDSKVPVCKFARIPRIYLDEIDLAPYMDLGEVVRGVVNPS